MAISSAATNLLGALLPEWHLLLQGWSASGRLTAAAQEALLLNGEPQALQDLVSQWSEGNFQAVPEIVLLSNADINGALGAYAISTGKIYLNADWLAIATQEAINAVLTEELGHHLDGLLNAADTPGDEGEYFARLLGGTSPNTHERIALRAQRDLIFVDIENNLTAAESAVLSSFDIAVNGDALQDVSQPTNRIQLLSAENGVGSAWRKKLVNLAFDWETSFSVSAFNGSGTSDGFTFAINGDSRGVNAIGDNGQNLGFFGYDTNIGVRNSYAVLFDMWTTGPSSLLGFAPSSTSSITQGYETSPLSLANNAYNVGIKYSALLKILSVTIGGQTIDHYINLQLTVGSFAYLGFTAANGGGTMDIDISDWDVIATDQVTPPGFPGIPVFFPNTAPTDLIFTSSGVQKNSAAATVIGTLSATDPDAGSTFTYALVAGNGTNDADNALVDIVGNQARVKSGAAIDFETNPVLNLNIRVTDNGNPGLSYTKAVTVAVLNINETPGIGIITTEPVKAWTRLLGSASVDEARSVTTSSDGSIYIAGLTTRNLDGNNFAGGYGDAFLSKYNSDGSKSWTRLLGSPLYDSASSISSSSDGSIYIAGSTIGNLDGNTNAGYDDAFLSKYNSDGSKSWTRLLGSPLGDSARSVSSSIDGSIYIAGYTAGNLDGNIFAGGDSDAFLSKYNSDGSKSWTQLLGSTSNESAQSVTTSSDGSIYIAGYALGNLDGNTNAGGYSDAFLSKYNSDGSKSWTRLLGSTANESAQSVTTSSDGSIYIAGTTTGSLDGNTNAGGGDTFLSKYNSDGSKSWTRLLGSTANEFASSVTTSSDGSIYIAGYTTGNLDGNTNAGGGDTFLSKYNSDGSKSWTRLLGSSLYDSASSVSTSSDGSIYIAGYTTGNLDGNTNAGGDGDAFLTKYTIDANEAPTDLIFTSSGVQENSAASTVIGTLSATDPDAGSTFTYALATGNGTNDADNALVDIVGNEVRVKSGAVIDFETNPVLNLNIRVTDNGNPGLTFIKAFGISVLNANDAPTGTPTLSGTTKVGQVITIDRTTLQDSDNFNGYIPTYIYSFEVSNDNGTTWTKLTTTDATDNNTSYTLTTEDLGKQVRGVVSYLDGYGTQESVASTASAPISSSAPPVQSLTLSPPSKTSIRSGVSTTSAITYNVSTGDTALTGIGVSLFFDSTQLTVNTAGDPFKTGLLGSAITADTTNADGDSKTDKILSLTYADFGGNFPGTGTTLPLTLANLNLVPTTTYSGTTLHLQGTPAVGFTATGADLTLGYNAAPTVTGTLSNKTINLGSAFIYTVPSGLFTDPDSTLSISAKTTTGAALPAWLTFNATTGTFTGTPTSSGTFNLAVAAADELGSVSAPLILNVREVQSVSSSATDIRYQRNKDVTVPINYSTTDGSQTTGMSFKVHYNSSLFSFDPVTGVSNKATADLFQIGAVQSDTSNTDGDTSTDKFIPINVASFSGSFPSGATPIKLADLIFKAADKAIDPLTGLKDTKINFSETEAAQGYGFQGTGASLKPMSFSLDVDGDGKVTALGDGLMVIRHLFGSAFSGSALTDKAISPTSPFLGGVAYNTMTAEQKNQVASLVATNIQQGIDAGLLDVDKDGKTTALGDGLMVIRRLIGAAFDGASLTNKAIGPSSPYFGPPADFASVAFNIDALRPTIF